MKKNTKPIRLYNLDYTIYGEYPSIVEAAKSINCSEKTIRRALDTKKTFYCSIYLIFILYFNFYIYYTIVPRVNISMQFLEKNRIKVE